MERQLDEEICLFVRDQQAGRFLFNAEALQALGFDLLEVQQRGCRLKQQSALVEKVETSPPVSHTHKS